MAVERSFRGVVHLREGSVLWASRGMDIHRSADEGETWEKVVTLPVRGTRALAGRFRLGRRLLRMMVYHLVIVKSRYLVALAFGRTYAFDLQRGAAFLGGDILRGKRPLSLRGTRDGRLLYGEYRGNAERTPIAVWASRDLGATWFAIHTFQRIRHVHGVFEDPYDDALWITTGDEDDESAIWRADPDFGRLERVVHGDQQARVISLEFTADALYYGTDTPLEHNAIYELPRGTLTPRRIADVEGSVFHSCRCGDDVVFSTACEPSQVNRVRDAIVHRVDREGRHERIAAWRKDRWPMKLFQYGQVFLVGSPRLEDGIWATPFATCEDQRSRRIVLA